MHCYSFYLNSKQFTFVILYIISYLSSLGISNQDPTKMVLINLSKYRVCLNVLCNYLYV